MKLDDLFNRLGKTVFIAFISLLLLTISLLLIELIARQYYRTTHDQPSPKSDLAYSYFDWSEEHKENIKKIDKSLLYTPYHLWRFPQADLSTISIGQDGFRTTANPAKKYYKKKISLFVFGGSTAFGLSSPDELNIPSQLSKQLNDKYPDIFFEISNFSGVGYLSDQEIIILVDLLKKNRIPDIAIFYDGVNDTLNKVIREAPHMNYNNFVDVSKRPSTVSFLWTRHATKSYVLKLINESKPNSKKNKERLRKNIVKMHREYKRNVEFVKSLAKQYGFRPYFYWQPDLISTNKTLSTEERSNLELPERLNMIGGFKLTARYFQEHPLKYPFINITDAFNGIEESIFIDYCHVNAIGHRAIAQKMADEISKGHLE
ncbi:hypothetical protein ACFL1S_00185 [Pseudomonadota bacterium]